MNTLCSVEELKVFRGFVFSLVRTGLKRLFGGRFTLWEAGLRSGSWVVESL